MEITMINSETNRNNDKMVIKPQVNSRKIMENKEKSWFNLGNIRKKNSEVLGEISISGFSGLEEQNHISLDGLFKVSIFKNFFDLRKVSLKDFSLNVRTFYLVSWISLQFCETSEIEN